MKYKIPFNKVDILGSELANIQQAVDLGHTAGDGNFTKKCQQLLQDIIGAPKALLTTSCTHALEMSALLLDVQPGDEVIVPSYTFVSTVNAFVLFGAKPVFCDIRKDTLNLDETKLSKLITKRTKVIVPVHYAGVGCEMDAIMAYADKEGIAIVEDNAHGLMGRYQGKNLGSFGKLATLSFHETKNFSCGEGGALIINDPELVERAEIIREKGTDRSKFFRGQIDKYSWVDVGSSYLPSDILAAFLKAQLDRRDEIQSNRKRIWEFYHTNLNDWADNLGIRLPFVPSFCDHPYHMFYLLMPSYNARKSLIAYLAKNGILSVFHYMPLHSSKMGIKFGYSRGDCPISEDISERLVRLPFYSKLSNNDLDYVVETLLNWRFKN